MSIKNGLSRAKNVYIFTNDLFIQVDRKNERLINNNNDIYICGGLSIYLQTTNIADEVILSVISSKCECDIKIDMNF
ncbi:dihydrofolate reductase [Mycoplasmopsis anatis]|uniref:dihydrofolate reductase n=1 Tax=Mycoplasmopsis anatis TaxID=171279 RepID=UPI001C4E0A33|nr:dihydrofolate reductase [Mycoplasmopsis anatis]